MPHPYPGQEWKHGWIPLTPGAAREKNHGRPLKGGKGTTSKPASKTTPERGSAHQSTTKPAKRPAKAGPSKPATPAKSQPAPAGKAPTGSKPQAKDKAFLDSHYGEWKDNLSPAQEKAMRFYQSPGFALMNGQLRGLDRKDIKADVTFDDADLKRAQKASKDLHSAIRKAPPLKEPITVYRGFSADQFGDLKPGMELKDKAFVSTSLTPDVGSVGKASRPATAEIVLPEGTKAAAGSSRELVLPPGSRFRVRSVTSRRGVPHVEMELIL
jgi:hypothetical protein